MVVPELDHEPKESKMHQGPKVSVNILKLNNLHVATFFQRKTHGNNDVGDVIFICIDLLLYL